jgi:hypothetical protein
MAAIAVAAQADEVVASWETLDVATTCGSPNGLRRCSESGLFRPRRSCCGRVRRPHPWMSWYPGGRAGMIKTTVWPIVWSARCLKQHPAAGFHEVICPCGSRGHDRVTGSHVRVEVAVQRSLRFETRLWNLVDARLRAECDLQLTWFEPMQVMSSSGACRVYDIVEELSITIGGTSKLVDSPRSSNSPQPGDGCWPEPMRCLRTNCSVDSGPRSLPRHSCGSVRLSGSFAPRSTSRPTERSEGRNVIVALAPYPTTRGASQ